MYQQHSLPWKFEIHDDVIKWKHFPRYWPFVRGIHRSPVNSPHKGQWRGALMFTLICARINGWVNNREAGDLRRYRAHYDVIVMVITDKEGDWGRKEVVPHMSPCFICIWKPLTLRWRHNEPDGVSNHQPWDCLLNCLFRCRSKKIPKLRVTGLCAENSPGPVNSPHKRPVTRKMFPFDDVIMTYIHMVVISKICIEFF